uniref:CHK domain-containing protein n=1 Tax=Caenorhabditis tropicalis TaxID=1561998 RepID=A0A1I7TAU6_9PELO
MSLYEVADGILETHVTWKDVEEKLQKSFQTDAIFGKKKSVKNISDQKGYMSKIALIHLDWQNVEDKKSLPEKIAVKISSQLPFIEFSKELKYTDDNGYEDQKLKFLGKILREAHNREVEAYKLLERFNHPDIPVTKIHALKYFSNESDLKGYIIMEYIPDIHSTSMSEFISADDLIPTIRGVAKFAALGHTLSDKEKEFALGAEFLEYYFDTFLGSASIESTLENLKNTFSYVETSKVEKLMKIYRHYIKIVNRYTKISELLGFEMIFNHGDLWQSNILYGTEANGKLKLKAIIDWQALSLLPPGFDMARLFIGSLSIEDRRNRAVELLKIYHETFSSVLGRELFSFQQVGF